MVTNDESDNSAAAEFMMTDDCGVGHAGKVLTSISSLGICPKRSGRGILRRYSSDRMQTKY